MFELKGSKEEIRKQLLTLTRWQRELYLANGTLKSKYELIIKEIRKCKGKTRLHLNNWNGSYKHMRLNDTDQLRYRTVLNAFNVPYTVGNDAPRGGATGEYIEFTVDKRKKLFK